MPNKVGVSKNNPPIQAINIQAANGNLEFIYVIDKCINVKDEPARMLELCNMKIFLSIQGM